MRAGGRPHQGDRRRACARWRASATTSCSASPTFPTPPCRRAARRPTRWSAAGASRARSTSRRGRTGRSAAELGMLDLPARRQGGGERLSASTRGMGARLQRALINFMLDLHTREHGYTEVAPPFVVNREAMQGTGQYPKFVEEGDAYYSRGRALPDPHREVPVTNLHRDELLDGGAAAHRLHRLLALLSPRGGVGGEGHARAAAGAPVRQGGAGALRAAGGLRGRAGALTGHAERVLQLLGLPYRVLLLAGGDLGFSSTQDVRPGGVGAGRGPLAGGVAALATSATSRRAAPTSASGRSRGEAGVRAHAERLRAWRCRAPSSPSSRTASRQTARVIVPSCCARTWERTV